MRGLCYDIEELESIMAVRVRILENGYLATGIDDLRRWKSVIDQNRYYFEEM